MTDQPQRAGRSAVIDAFRLGGVLYIVGYFHLPWYVSYVPGIGNPLVKAAVVLALGLFVLVSGYLLGNTDRSGQWVTRFYRRRFVRIYVPFVLTSIVFLAMSLEDLATFAKSIFLVAMFLPPPPLTLWFVTMIGLFYVLAPVLITASERPVGLLLIAAATMAALLIYHGLWRLDPRIAIYFPDFAAGIYFLAPRTAAFARRARCPRRAGGPLRRSRLAQSPGGRARGIRARSDAMRLARAARGLHCRDAFCGAVPVAAGAVRPWRGQFLHLSAASPDLSRPDPRVAAAGTSGAGHVYSIDRPAAGRRRIGGRAFHHAPAEFSPGTARRIALGMRHRSTALDRGLT